MEKELKTLLISVFDHLKEHDLVRDIVPLANIMIKYLLKYAKKYPDHNQIKIIIISLNNIKNTSNFASKEQFFLFKKDITNIFKAIEIYTRSMMTTKNEKCREIEQKLFNISFIPNENNETKILPIYLLHDDFIDTNNSICSLKSSTGSGKTRCAPFFFALKSLKSHLEQPFFIMTQPSTTIIKDKIEDFSKILGKSVELICNDFLLFKKIIKRQEYYKPVVALFTPHNLAKILSQSKEIHKRARFALDEIHERSVETDVITAILAQRLQDSTIPLHLLMMTATPDIRTIKLFKEDRMKNFNLEDSLLFPIEYIKKQSPDFKSLDNIAQEETFHILTRMFSKQIRPGHILIFTSGNRRIKNIIDLIHLRIKELPQEIRLIRTNEKSMKNRKVFYENLNEQVKDDNLLYILLMKYAGYLSQEEKEIGKNPIPNHPNVIKVIIATNAIESSITIDGLAAVIDCGIFNQPVLDKIKGISKLEESPISIQSQTQRRGRVGRKRNGICVQLTVRNHPPVKLISPAIEKEDISSDILALRKIGIKLEEIKNLPEPGVNPMVMRNYLQELKSFGALDSSGNLTNIGDELQKFTSLLPFVSTSILEVSKMIQNKDDQIMGKIVGSLIFHIMSTKDLYVDPFTEGFRRNFNPDSDVITLLKSIIEAMLKEGKRKFNIESFGFHSGNALRLIGNIEQTASNFLGENRESLWNDIESFVNKYDMMSFIQIILQVIQSHKKQWTTCRRAQYFTVSNVLNKYKLVYHGDSSLEDNYSSVTEIFVDARPGAKGFATPGQCYILQITKGDNDKYYGSIVHKNTSVKETCHPLILLVPVIMESPFTVPLIEAYLGENASLFRPFQKTNQHQETKHGGFICYPDQYDGSCSIISYAPNDIEDHRSIQMMRESCSKVINLIKFTPRTILVRNDVLKALVAVTGYGSEKFSTKIIDYVDYKTIPYQIDKVTMDYMLSRTNEMNDVDGHLSIAMTGEKFFYTSEDEDFRGFPITWPTATCVFGTSPLFYSHLVVISDIEIPSAKKLTWVDPSISVTYSDVDALVHIANTMYRGVVSVFHNYDFLYTMTKNANCQIEGRLPQFRGITQQSDVHRPIGHMFDLYAMKCIQNDSLIHNVELVNFGVTGDVQGQSLSRDIKAIKRIKKEISNEKDLHNIINYVQKNIQPYYFRINSLKAEREQLSRQWNMICNNKSLRAQAIQRQKEIKNEISDEYDGLNSCKRSLFQCGLSENSCKSLLSMNTPLEILSINQLFVYPNYFRALVKVDDVEFTINKMKSYRSDLDVEVLPRCELVIHHKKNCRLNRYQFEEQIKNVCNRFGRVIETRMEYRDINNNFDRGTIRVSLHGGDFVVPFVGEIKKAIGFNDKVPLKIPFRIVPFCIRFRQNVIDAIRDWIQLNRLKLQQSGAIFIGSQQEVEKALSLLNSNNAKPEIPYKSYTIPGGISIPHVVSSVNKLNRSLSNNKKWAVDKQTDLQTRFLIVPSDTDENVVNAFFNKIRKKTGTKPIDDDDILYDYLLCCGNEDATLSGSQIPLFNEDGTFVCHNFCTTCAYDLILHSVGNLFDQEDSQPRMDLVLGNVEPIKPISPVADSKSDQWPSIPFGQLLWSLVSEPKLTSVTKTWFSAIVYQALHSFFEFCPDHPKILLRKKKHGILRCSKRDCQMFLCPNCWKWHKNGQCNDIPEIPMGFRVCPNCHRPIEKTQDCNHISCSCGKHFCYFCGWGPEDDDKAVYRHMGREHGGCFNDPPDYRRMRGEDVPDAEIEAFYRKYPKLMPLGYSSPRRMRHF